MAGWLIGSLPSSPSFPEVDNMPCRRQPTSTSIHPPPGRLLATVLAIFMLYRPGLADERLEYRIRLGPIPAGEATLLAQAAAGADDERTLLITLSIRSHGLLSALFPIRDRLVSRLRAADLRVLSVERRIREGPRHLRETWQLDHEQELARELGGRQVRVPADVHDPLAALWRLRRVVLAPGDTCSLPLFIGAGATRLHVAAGTPEDVSVPSGTFRCLPLAPSLGRPQGFDPAAGVIIHRRVDGAGVPVLFEVELPIAGRARIELVSHESDEIPELAKKR